MLQKLTKNKLYSKLISAVWNLIKLTDSYVKFPKFSREDPDPRFKEMGGRRRAPRDLLACTGPSALF
jgi:hypothetical protein